MAGIVITPFVSQNTTLNITAQGYTDYALWNLGSGSGTTVAPTIRKSGGGSLIGSMTRTVATLDGFTALLRATSWSDGTPTASGSNTNGLYNTLNSGGTTTNGADCSFTVPADTTTRECYFYIGAFASNVTLTCTLSDGSAGPTSDTSMVNGSTDGADTSDGVFKITYSAGSAGQTLTVRAVAASAGFSQFSDVEPYAVGLKVLSGGTSVSPAQAAVTLAGQAPTIARTANQGVSPSQGAVAFNGPAPTIAQSSGQSVSPAQAAVAFSGPAPTVVQTANQGVSPGQGALAFSGLVPTVQQTNGLTVIPGAGSVSFAGFAPGVAQSANQQVVPGAGAVALQGLVPAVTQSANQAVLPGAGALSFLGFPPTFTQASASVNVTPGVGVLTLTGYAPDVLQSGGAGGVSKPKKKRFIGEYIRELPSEEKEEPEVVEQPKKAERKVEKIVQKVIESDDEDEIEALMLLL